MDWGGSLVRIRRMPHSAAAYLGQRKCGPNQKGFGPERGFRLRACRDRLPPRPSKGQHMNAFSLSPDGKLAITASETSSKNDFDYLVGNWNIRNRTLKEPLAGSDEWDEFDATQEFRLILLGLGNFDIFHAEFDGKPFEGLTVRLFDPQTRLWTIYWADSDAVKLDDGKVGSFDGDIGEFFGREVVAGKDAIVKFHWDKRNPKAPIYSRAFSADEGRTWEWNWYSKFSPR
ncbi:DUF1579 domain-containing protein [Luteimonas sp. SX5]|uniref:DUF1579 domain-containing protein n=1 Tax=Luteimonas galliterrae TaxID=2940486 RepID=A0ABT0MIW9_9GAMM|nr:DUF1579 domain-containing protein [Luteimonas galliterrae]MCL1634818.1 DUF1579 domain-containing protein [Luteimonas galliterrae]